MKITSKLAMNQLIRNKKRTSGTVLAIVLSTVLITTIMCFASSAVAMLKSALGNDFDEYGGVYNAMIFIPAFILTGLIVFMSVSVISNIFQASANDRIKELGILKCVGGTSKQIKKTVISEGLWLSIISIPIGLILGILIGYLGIKIADSYIDNLVEITKSIVMRRFELKLEFSVNVYSLIFSSVFSLFTVLISAQKPAKQMSKITAVECVRFGNKHSKETSKISGSSFWKKLWGFEGELGVRNISRNKKSFKPAIKALSMGICLLLATFGLAAQLNDLENYMKSKNNRLLVDYTSLRNEGNNPDTGRRQDIILNPINSETYNEINEKLNAFGDFEVWGIGGNKDTYYAKADSSEFTEAAKKTDGMLNEFGEMEFDMVSMTDDLYRNICEATGTKYGGNILINTYTYNESGERKEITPFSEELKEFTLVTPDGQTSSLEIDGFLDRSDLDEWLFDYLNRATVMVIIPGASARSFDWQCEPGEQEEEFTEYARSVMDEYYPVLSDDSYEDQGYSVRISREDTIVKAVNVMLVLGEVILYGFVILISLIGFVGFISTVAANIRARSKEFAVLKSVGMTSKALKKMLYSESMYCTMKATVKGGILGLLIPWLINLSIRNAFPIKFHLPLYVAIFSVCITYIVVLTITYIEIKKFKKQNLIETIRMDSIR